MKCIMCGVETKEKDICIECTEKYPAHFIDKVRCGEIKITDAINCSWEKT